MAYYSVKTFGAVNTPACSGMQRVQFTSAVISVDFEQEVWLFLFSPLPFFHQPNGRAALLHGEAENPDEKVPPHSPALPRAVPGTVWRPGPQWHHPGKPCTARSARLGLRMHVMSRAGPSLAGLSLETFSFHFCRTCMCVRKRSQCWWARLSPPCLRCRSNKVNTTQHGGRSPGTITACQCGQYEHKINFLILKWMTKRSLTSEGWDWTG